MHLLLVCQDLHDHSHSLFLARHTPKASGPLARDTCRFRPAKMGKRRHCQNLRRLQLLLLLLLQHPVQLPRSLPPHSLSRRSLWVRMS